MIIYWYEYGVEGRETFEKGVPSGMDIPEDYAELLRGTKYT